MYTIDTIYILSIYTRFDLAALHTRSFKLTHSVIIVNLSHLSNTRFKFILHLQSTPIFTVSRTHLFNSRSL